MKHTSTSRDLSSFRAILVLVVFALLCNSSFADEKTEAADKIKELKKQRFELLVKIHKDTIERQQVDNVVTFDNVRQAKLDLFGAWLDLAKTPEDRIKIYEEGVKDAEAWEKKIGVMLKAGAAPAIDAAKVQAYVLETRIALAKAKMEK